MVWIAGLHVYPVKSCAGIGVTSATLTDAGLEHDREWMIVTDEGRFVTQRELPRLALITPALDDGHLSLSAPGSKPVRLPLGLDGAACEVTVWRDRCRAFDQGEPVARWLSDFCGRRLRLVRFDRSVPRLSDAAFTGGTAARSLFSDGYALLAIAEASLDDLNARLAVPLPMNRFRPNLVLAGLPAYGEDALGDLAVGEARLRRVKPCTRCSITTTDQSTGAVDGDEPLRTLKSYRWDPVLRGVTFGQNLIVVSGHGARLAAGDELRSPVGPALPVGFNPAAGRPAGAG